MQLFGKCLWHNWKYWTDYQTCEICIWSSKSIRYRKCEDCGIVQQNLDFHDGFPDHAWTYAYKEELDKKGKTT